MPVSSTLDHLECTRCRKVHDAGGLARLCTCGAPLFARYRLDEARRTLTPASVAGRPRTMWRYQEVLPGGGEPVSLGEGMTPLVHGRRLGESLGMAHLFIKNEAVNPTGSFKARGIAAAVAVARSSGVTRAVIPSAGNAGGALAAYGARAGIAVRVYLPESTPAPFLEEAKQYGAEVVLVPGTIADCARRLGADDPEGAWFDVSTLKEPYRIEGKKTMGYELFEQGGARLPDAIVYPTGGGTGLIGMWKAFDEMERLGWIRAERPRMYSVQAAGCAPIVRAFEAGEERAAPWEGGRTRASGLLVPSARGDFLILSAVRASGGAAVAVEDDAMSAACMRLGASEGIDACPEGGATLAALEHLLARGAIAREERVVLFNTGTGLKYR